MKKSLLKIYYRIYQAVLRLGVPILPWRTPKLIEGAGSLSKLPKVIADLSIKRVLIVTDKGLMQLGMVAPLLEGLGAKGISYTIYDGTVPNPTINNIEDALKLYHSGNCEAIIAFGGGSPMDCAKVVGARVARPNKPIPKMKGLMKVLFKIPTLFAIPTTAGTGSETTVAAVVSDSRTHEKYAINDTALIPSYAVLDPELTVGLPKHVTSVTGIDALTHVVESYIGQSNTKETRDAGLKALSLIHANLYEAYINPTNIEARENMLKASFLAGFAFTRALLGYVHAIAHTLGGFYGVPHGLANAVVMPYVLEYYGAPAHKKLAELADHIGITGKDDAEKASKFIAYIREFNRKMDIPDKITGIKKSDIPKMVDRALDEGNPFYPVPRILFREDMEILYNRISG